MQVFVESIDYNSKFKSVDEYIEIYQPKEGEEFELVQITVIAATKYKMIEGRPQPQSMSFAESLS